MKRNLQKYSILSAAAVAALMAGMSVRADYSSTVLGDGPAAYWRFSETGVAPTIDYATNTGTFGFPGYGVYQEGALHPVTGALVSDPGNAAVQTPNVNGSGGGPARVRIPWQADLNANSAFSVEFWAKPAFTNDIACPAGSVDFNATTRYGWLFYQGPPSLTGGNGWFFRLYHTAGNTLASIPLAIDTNQWYRLVGTYDGASTIVLYVNGSPVATGTLGGTYTPNVNRTDVPMTFGARADGAAGNYGWGGSLDEPAYYTNALSPADVLAHYQAGTNPSPATAYATLVQSLNPAVYLRLNEPAFTPPVAANSGSLGSTANGSYRYWSTTTTELDGPTYPGFATTNRVLQTSGTNGFVSAPALNLNTNTVTMECWIKRNGDQASYNGVLFHRGGGGTATGIMFTDVLNNLGYHWSDSYYDWDSGLIPPDGVWTYVALAISPEQAVIYMYDGTTWSSAVNVASHGVQAFAATTRVATDDGTGRFFNGLVDEAAIYGKTLTEGELRTHALAGFGDPAHNKPTLVTDPPAVSPSGTIYSTTPFSITADAYGEAPLTFQWQHEGTNLPSATTRTFARTAAALSDAGNYAVIVGNAYGSVTSAIVNITINAAVPPTITNQPLTRLVYTGGTASFSVGADGTVPFTYQWKHAGTNLPGATSRTIIVANCTAEQAGAYSVGVTNVAGGVLSLSATLTLRTPAPGSFEEKVVTNGPVAYWRLGESSGATAYDYAGGNDGTISGGASQGATGLASPGFPGMEAGNTGYGFDGSSGYVLVGNPASLNFAGQITMMAWVKPSDTVGLRNILCHGHQTSPNNAEVGIRINAGVYTAWSWDGGVEASFAIPPEDIGNWVQVVGTHDGTAWRLYHNGVEVAATASTVGAKVVSDTGWAIGARGTGTERFFSGDVDEVAIYNKALSADTIAAMYATAVYGATTRPFVTRNPASATVGVGSTATLTGAANGSLPIAYQWKKDGVDVPGATSATLALTNVYFTDAGSYVLWATNGVGFTNTAPAALTVMPPPTFANLTNDLVLHLRFDDNFVDTSGRANDASAMGNPPSFLTGKIGKGVHIATTPGDSYLVVSDGAGDLAFDASASFTIALWLKYTVGFNDVPIIGNAINSTWQLGWVFTDSATAGKLEWSLVSTANTSTYLRDPVPGCPTINDGTWHHVVGVVDRAKAEALVYVDGLFAGSWSIAGLGTLDYGNAITIGQDPTGNYGTATFDLDDVGIWRRALTGYEAASIYGAAQNGTSFDVKGAVRLYYYQVGGFFDLGWQSGTLLQSPTVNGTYTPVSGAAAPFHRITPSGSAAFFRVQQ